MYIYVFDAESKNVRVNDSLTDLCRPLVSVLKDTPGVKGEWHRCFILQ